VRAVCVVQMRETGRPEVCYGRPPKAGDEEHEVRVAEIEVVTGWRIERCRLGKAQPDGVATVNGQTCAIEVDNSRMSRKQYAAKWKTYDGVDAFILVITTSEQRMQKLRADAATSAVADRVFYSTFSRLENVAEPWVDCSGNALRLG
jgi:hypothetical protein